MNHLQAAAANLAGRMTVMKPAPAAEKREHWAKERFACPHCGESPKELVLPTGSVWLRRTDCCVEARMVFACQQLMAAYNMNTPEDEAAGCLQNALAQLPHLTRSKQKQLIELEASLKAQRIQQQALSTFNPRGFTEAPSRPFGSTRQHTNSRLGGGQ